MSTPEPERAPCACVRGACICGGVGEWPTDCVVGHVVEHAREQWRGEMFGGDEGHEGEG